MIIKGLYLKKYFRVFREDWGAALILIMLIAVGILFAVGHFKDGKRPIPVVKIRQEPIEFKIALTDGKDISDNSIDIKRIRYLLDEISSQSGESKERIAEIVYNFQQLLINDYGKKYTMTELMESIKNVYNRNTGESINNVLLLLMPVYAD